MSSSRFAKLAIALLLSAAFLSIGCSTTHMRNHFDLSKYKDPILDNTIKDPVFLVMLAATGVSAIDKHDTQDWFSDKKYFTGSEGEHAGDIVRDVLRASSIVGAPAAQALIAQRNRSDRIPSNNWDYFVEGVTVSAEAHLVTLGLTGGLKELTNEERPTGDDDKSFPSGHSSSAFVSAALLDRALATEIKINGWDPNWRYLSAIPYTAASFVGVSRVEHDRHYLHDVLFGATMGRAIGNIVYDLHYKVPEEVETAPGDGPREIRSKKRDRMFRLNGHLIPVLQPDYIGVQYAGSF